MHAKWPEWPPHEPPSVSYLSYGMFDACRRKWLNRYRYLGYPEALSRELRAQGLLLPFGALTGRLVDDVLKDALREYRERGTWNLDLELRASELLASSIEDSKLWAAAARDPAVHPKDWPDVRQPLDRVYYGDPPTEAELAQVLAKAHLCLRNFADSGMKRYLEGFPRGALWCPPRQWSKALPWFLVEDVPVYASFDLLIHTQEQTVVVDWKTGSLEGRRQALEQLHWYAAFAVDELGADPGNVRLMPCWLATGPQPFHEYAEPVDRELLDALRGRWIERSRTLRDLLGAVRFDAPALEPAFPPTDDRSVCSQCAFRSCPSRLL